MLALFISLISSLFVALGWPERQAEHDKGSLIRVIERLERARYEVYPIGVETFSERLREALRLRFDPVSLLLRFRSDLVVVDPLHRLLPFLVEVKTVLREHTDFAVDAHSWLAAELYRGLGADILFVFVKKDGPIYAIWFDELAPLWHTCLVPRRTPGWEEMEVRMNSIFSHLEVKTIPHRVGSGTPMLQVCRDAVSLGLEDALGRAKGEQ